MMQLPTSAPDSTFVLSIAAFLVAPLALAGLALVNTGLGRSRSAAQSFLGSLLLSSIGILSCVLTSGLWHHFGQSPAIAYTAGAFSALPVHDQLAMAFTLIAAGIAPLIPWGAGADRLRLSSGVVIAALIGGVGIPLLSSAAWDGGWLAQLGARFGLGDGLIDYAGSGILQGFGGITALAMLWVTGSRKGKFPKPGLATAIPGHQVIYVLFGAFLALIGWLGLNAAGALINGQAAGGSVIVVALNTVLMAVTALVATFIGTRIRFGKPDASLCANGWLAGLVASSAGAPLFTPLQAILIGATVGIITPLLVEVLELALSIDDPSGAIPVHLVSGLLGVFCAGLFSAKPGQLIAQLVGISVLLGLCLPALYVLFMGINHVLPFRVDADGERLGMDMHELGGSAYPEFVIHRDDSYR